jgi:hypothetical protein
MQILVPRASFVGHLGGILGGYAISFGVFSWVTPWWRDSSFGLLLLMTLVSLVATTHFRVPGVHATRASWLADQRLGFAPFPELGPLPEEDERLGLVDAGVDVESLSSVFRQRRQGGEVVLRPPLQILAHGGVSFEFVSGDSGEEGGREDEGGGERRGGGAAGVGTGRDVESGLRWGERASETASVAASMVPTGHPEGEVLGVTGADASTDAGVSGSQGVRSALGRVVLPQGVYTVREERHSPRRRGNGDRRREEGVCVGSSSVQSADGGGAGGMSDAADEEVDRAIAASVHHITGSTDGDSGGRGGRGYWRTEQ